MDDNAQMQTIEAVISAAMMMLIIVFSIGATSITPLTSSTANAHVEAELQTLGEDMLNILDYTQDIESPSSLRRDILNWTGSRYVWNGSCYADQANKTGIPLENNLTNLLSFSLKRRGIAHNVEIIYFSSDGSTLNSLPFIWDGDPSNNAVSVSRKLVLHDREVGSTFNATGIRDMDPQTDIYNIIVVKLTLWRM